MKLYLVRHGEYLDYDIRQPGALSEKGRQDIQQMADFLGRSPVPVTHIYHSGKRRAQETAELLSKGFQCEQAIEARQGLDPSDEVQPFIDEIIDWEDDIVVVGHLPFMSLLTSKLVTGDQNKEVVSFLPGTLVCLEKIQNSRWIIRWVLGPDLF